MYVHAKQDCKIKCYQVALLASGSNLDAEITLYRPSFPILFVRSQKHLKAGQRTISTYWFDHVSFEWTSMTCHLVCGHTSSILKIWNVVCQWCVPLCFLWVQYAKLFSIGKTKMIANSSELVFLLRFSSVSQHVENAITISWCSSRWGGVPQ